MFTLLYHENNFHDLPVSGKSGEKLGGAVSQLYKSVTVISGEVGKETGKAESEIYFRYIAGAFNKASCFFTASGSEGENKSAKEYGTRGLPL